MITFTALGNLGRLGNQIGQLATAISLAIDNNDEYVFPPWIYEEDFNLHDCFSNDIRPTIAYKEPHYHYAKIPHTDTAGQVVDLFGYFQSYRYFENNKNIIMGLLTPKIGYPKQYNCTSIHVRRGDYLGLTKEYEQLGMDYYRRAINLINSKRYLVFSDDIGWCKRNFVGEQFEFCEDQHPPTALSRMISCEHNIIANSSFSWWGAYLNKNPSKIVVAPHKWFGPALPHNTIDLIPNDWIKV